MFRSRTGAQSKKPVSDQNRLKILEWKPKDISIIILKYNIYYDGGQG